VSLEIGCVLDLVVASSLYYIAAALLLPDSLDRVAVGDWSVALVEFASM
jgi:hypothetical protein